MFEKYYATSTGEAVGLQKRETFDATFATLRKRYNPSEILSNQMTLVMGGVAKILLGTVQVGTAGLSAPITGAMIGLVDLGTSDARAGLGQAGESGGEAVAGSGMKTIMISTATRVLGPVAPFSLGRGYAAASAIPVVGGVGAIVLGFKDIADGLKGIQLSQDDIVFMRHSVLEIRGLKSRVAVKAQEMAAIPELRGMSAKWMECAKALAVVERVSARCSPSR